MLIKGALLSDPNSHYNEIKIDILEGDYLRKIGRNDMCPCGSGKKYKRCCVDKEDDPSFTDPSNFFNTYKDIKHKSKIKRCMHPNQDECSERIIGAHSIQNNKILKHIADDGCVYMPYPKNDNPFAITTKWGRKEATVFTGFCGYHDNELFKPIENNTFNKSDEHIFLHTYRTFALGYHRKCENVRLQQIILQKKPSLVGEEEIEDMFFGDRLAVKDLEEAKTEFDRAILNKKYGILTHITWEFDKVINFAASGHTALTKDLKGDPIQDLRDKNTTMKHVFFTVFPEEGKSYCILSWVKSEADIFDSYKNQLLDLTEQQKISYLNNLIPMESENIVIKPSAWDSLTSLQQQEFGLLIWNIGYIYEMMSGESLDMLEQPSFNLFDL